MTKKTDTKIVENETEVEMTPNQMAIAAVLAGDHVALGDAFNASVRAKINSALFGDAEDDEEDAEPAQTEEEAEPEAAEELDESYHDWTVKVHKGPKHDSEHQAIKVRARSNSDAKRFAREKAGPEFLHPLTAVRVAGTRLLNKRA